MQLHGLINGQEDFWNEEKNLHLCKVKLRIDDLRFARKLQLSRQVIIEFNNERKWIQM